MAAPKLTPEQRRKIAADALAMAREIGADLGVTLADLEAMTLEELLSLLAGAGVEIDVQALEDMVRASLGNEVRALDRGIPLDPNAQDQIEAKVQAAVAKTAQQTARETVFGLHDAAQFGSDERPWDEQFYMWVSVGEGVCPTCYSYHGDVFALDQWESIGRPRDGGTLCGKHCRCKLVPVQADRSATERRFEEARTNLQKPPGA